MKLEAFDLNLLLVFDALATERSVTEAAALYGVCRASLDCPGSRPLPEKRVAA
jgi:hypothetical protein